MSKQLVINGLPDAIRLDGWWLACSEADIRHSAEQQSEVPSNATTLRNSITVSVLIVLVLLADLLFWDHPPGLSVALFAMALSVGIMAVRPAVATGREWACVLGFELICNLPVVDQIQALSLMFTGIGIAVLVVWVGYGRLVEWWQALWTIIRVSTVGLTLLPSDVITETKGFKATAGLRQQTKALILPVGVGLIFLTLLSAANPILEQSLDHLSRLEFLTSEFILRATFWMIVALFVWPYLNLTGAWLGPIANAPKVAPIRMTWLGSLVNTESVRNSLVLFNILFLMQTVMDIGVLAGGMALPDGMTYASYAHRGAYPLVATALLAGMFAIATHRMVRESRFLKNLLFLWLGQNLFLVFTAAFRLNLYVEAYSLTYLRVAAFVWMGLVFVGLALTIVQVTRGYSVKWLVRANLGVLVATLYLCSFVNFAWVIADYNIRNSISFDRMDNRYICGLGEQALPSILEYDEAEGRRLCTGYGAEMPIHSPIANWRDWGFREWRLQVYLAGKSKDQVIDVRPYSYR